MEPLSCSPLLFLKGLQFQNSSLGWRRTAGSVAEAGPQEIWLAFLQLKPDSESSILTQTQEALLSKTLICPMLKTKWKLT